MPLSSSLPYQAHVHCHDYYTTYTTLLYYCYTYKEIWCWHECRIPLLGKPFIRYLLTIAFSRDWQQINQDLPI